MPKRDVEQEIRNLNQLRVAPVTGASLTSLRRALRDRVNLVAAKAAQVISDLRLKELIPDLVAAFEHHLQHGAETDPQCWAKNALAKALTVLDHDESAPFVRGFRYSQMESTFGGKVDTAVTLRSVCTLALLQAIDLPRAAKLRHLIAAMNDREETVRIDALRAVEQMEGEEAALLLRLKALLGDERAAVVGQALESLLRAEGAPALDFARSFLEPSAPKPPELPSSPEELVEEAALAIGASRLPEAVEILQDAWAAQHQAVFLQAISTSRQQRGFDLLLDILRQGRSRDALAALDALSLHRDSPDLRAAVAAAVDERATTELTNRFRERFPDASGGRPGG